MTQRVTTHSPMEPPIRIKTVFDKDSVHTIYFNGKWITICHMNGKSTSIDADTLLDAGYNHLAAAGVLSVKKKDSQHGT